MQQNSIKQKIVRLTFEQILKRQLLRCQLCPNAITPETNGFLFLNYNPRFLAGFCKSCWQKTPEKQLEERIKKTFFDALTYAEQNKFGLTIRGAEVKF